MTTVYRIQYSEEAGYYVNTVDNVSRVHAVPVIWSAHPLDQEKDLSSEDGWRESQDEAIIFWQQEAEVYADKLRETADKIEYMARNRIPVQLPQPILRPTIE